MTLPVSPLIVFVTIAVLLLFLKFEFFLIGIRLARPTYIPVFSNVIALSFASRTQLLALKFRSIARYAHRDASNSEEKEISPCVSIVVRVVLDHISDIATPDAPPFIYGMCEKQ
jgi:hypothetical protein